MELETCLNTSILWLSTIIYCKNLTTYIFNLTKFDLFKKKNVHFVAPLNWQKLAMKRIFF